MITYNGSCWKTCRAFLETLDQATVSVVAAQELRVAGDDMHDAQHRAAKHGWKPYITPCRFTAAGLLIKYWTVIFPAIRRALETVTRLLELLFFVTLWLSLEFSEG